MRALVVLMLTLCLALPAAAGVPSAAAALGAPGQDQEQPSTTENPLAALKEELQRVLADARLPFTADQEQAIALMMEERRRASEELFGGLMDFRSGPTSGQEADRLRSAIEWMRNEFVSRLQNYLTAEQLAAWNRFQSSGGLSAPDSVDATPRLPAQTQTQYVRINNNAFTAEDVSFRGGGSGGTTEVIPRGGIGTWHGNAQFLIKDDALNARNAFAGNKPAYQERRLNVDVSGPTIPGRLTSSIAVSQTETENVDTIHATLPDRIFALGITRPNVYRQVNSRNTYQLSDPHSLGFYVWYGAESSKDQGIGGFTLPERASNSHWRGWDIELRQFSSLSSQSIYETRFHIGGGGGEQIPLSEAVRINVLDAFNAGGAQNRAEDDGLTYDFSNLYTRLGEKLTIKTGLEGSYRTERTFSTNNFGGTFTFSSLEAYLAGTPITYRVNRGNPLLETSQLELSFFMQNDLKLTPQLTLMFGVRYDAQTNLDDHNNISPRLGFAYSPARATVIRGGGGLFYSRLNMGMVQNQRRLDGTRQHEIVIDSPSYPNAFEAGTVRQTFPSVRVTDPDLIAPYTVVGLISVERTFMSNLFVTATYDFQREFHRFRTRNLNAPFDSTAPVPRACQPDQDAETCIRPDPGRGNVINLEATGNEFRHHLRLSFRKRFSLFSVSTNYQLQRSFGDVPGGQGAAATNSYDLRGDWGRIPNPLHNLSSTVNTQLPLGIFLSGTMSTNSGRYYTITTGRDDNRDTSVNDRPPGLPHNSARGPKYLNFNFNMSKAFFIGGANAGTRKNINLFVNMTNAFNRVHYGTPSGVMTSPNFGRSTSGQDPREIEAGLRFQF